MYAPQTEKRQSPPPRACSAALSLCPTEPVAFQTPPQAQICASKLVLGKGCSKAFGSECRMGPEGQEYLRRKRQQAERAATMAASRVSWEEELREARRQRVWQFHFQQLPLHAHTFNNSSSCLFWITMLQIQQAIGYTCKLCSDDS